MEVYSWENHLFLWAIFHGYVKKPKGTVIITLLLFNIAMKNGTFIDGVPIKNGDFPWLC